MNQKKTLEQEFLLPVSITAEQADKSWIRLTIQNSTQAVVTIVDPDGHRTEEPIHPADGLRALIGGLKDWSRSLAAGAIADQLGVPFPPQE